MKLEPNENKEENQNDEMTVSEKQLRTPEEHRLEADLRTCDPSKVDRTRPMDRERANIMATELSEGFELLKKYSLAATFFGSARTNAHDEIYTDAVELSKKLSKSGFAIISGGGGGIMEAANKGAYEVGGDSIGLNITLPYEQTANDYTTEVQTFNYFFTRKVMLTFASEVYVYFPGGFGTLDEFFEILTLIQTHKIKKIPIILYGKSYWEPIDELIKSHLCEKFQAIDSEDSNLYTIVDSLEEAYSTILDQVRC
ncbi:MAG: TIGR00730 family Rossman fold protein [Patescibacteria group bacterium UBA2163]